MLTAVASASPSAVAIATQRRWSAAAASGMATDAAKRW